MVTWSDGDSQKREGRARVRGIPLMLFHLALLCDMGGERPAAAAASHVCLHGCVCVRVCVSSLS